jgi:hypothetical protein
VITYRHTTQALKSKSYRVVSLEKKGRGVCGRKEDERKRFVLFEKATYIPFKAFVRNVSS